MATKKQPAATPPAKKAKTEDADGTFISTCG